MCGDGEMRARMLAELRRELAERRAARHADAQRAGGLWPVGAAGACLGGLALIAVLAL